MTVMGENVVYDSLYGIHSLGRKKSQFRQLLRSPQCNCCINNYKVEYI